MDSTFKMLAREVVEQRLRARHAEDRLRDLEQMLATLGLAIWETDAELRLLSVFGMMIAEPYLDGPLETFYRDAYGLDDPDADPLAAHREARDGRGVTLAFEHAAQHYAMLVEPRRDLAGEIKGTVGMAVNLAGGSHVT